MPDPDITWAAEGIVTDGMWADVTTRWMTDTELEISFGRQTEGLTAGLSDVEASKLSAKWRNHDNALTPRNSASPYPGWGPGVRLRVTETVGGVDFDLHTGYLEAPEVRPAQPGRYETVQISSTDLLGRLESAPAFRGTLAEHIRAGAGSSLVEWFPLDDASRPYISALSGIAATVGIDGFFDDPIPVEPGALLLAAEQDGPPGDDQRYALFAPVSDSTGAAQLGSSWLDITPLSITVDPGEVIALSAWVYMTPWALTAGMTQPPGTIAQLSGVGVTLGITDDDAVSDNGTYAGGTIGGAYDTVTAGRQQEKEAWRLVTVRLDTSTMQLDLWSGRDLVASTTHAGTVAAPLEFTFLRIGRNLAGAIGHVQVRVGDGTTFPWADHVAQHEHGFTGLERQTVAQRVTTLAEYAGVDASLVDMPASASTPMQVARLSGASPADAMRAAATAGQDTLRVTGSGTLTLIPRAERYGQQVAMQIPWGWLAADRVRYRTDKAANDVTVSRTGSGSGQVRRQDRTDQLTRGVSALPSIELDSAIDVDPGNLASWLARTYSADRTRITGLRINMLARTVAQRQALLSLRPGHRIQLTEVPAGQPEDITDLIVHGGRHVVGPGRRRLLELRLGPLLGPSVGEPPACPVVGDLCGSAVIAY